MKKESAEATDPKLPVRKRISFLERIRLKQKPDYIQVIHKQNPDAAEIKVYPIKENQILLILLDQSQKIIKTISLWVVDGYPVCGLGIGPQKVVETAERFIWNLIIEKSHLIWVKKVKKQSKYGGQFYKLVLLGQRSPKIIPSSDPGIHPEKIPENRNEIEKFKNFAESPDVEKMIFGGIKRLFGTDIAKFILFPTRLLSEARIYPTLCRIEKGNRAMFLYYFSPYGRFCMRLDAKTLVQKIIEKLLENARQ